MGQQQRALAERLKAAAITLETGPTDASSTDAASLLRYLGYDDGNRDSAQLRARMLRAGSLLRRLFLLPVPDAPGLVFFGGEADPAAIDERQAGLPIGSIAGSGLSPQRAFEACVGEGVEYLSQFLQDDDPARSGRFADFSPAHDADTGEFISSALAAAAIDADRRIAWVPAERLADGATVHFPLDLCYRRRTSDQDFKPVLKLSSGCAAGPTVEAATLRALLELVERDAVALWWRGGRHGREVTPEAADAAGDLLARVRQGDPGRKTWLLDITTDIELPAVAAVSARPDGYGFAIGFGARLDLAEAACAAVFELCQAELGQHVVAAKRGESGDGALRDGDLRQLRRSTGLDTRDCPLLYPQAQPDSSSATRAARPATSLQDILHRLTARGIAVHIINLTRPAFDVPVVRVLAPALQLEPCELVGRRLAGTIAANGGGARYHAGIPLF